MDIKGLKNQIAKWEKQIKDLKEKAEKEAVSGKAKIEAQIKELQSKVDDAKARLEKLSSKGKDILGKFKR
jgi:predicted  nucleic acid-binding Zn-ribbon protein